MPFKSFGVGCCCKKNGFQCKPCVCFNFYDPNFGTDTSDKNPNIYYSIPIIYQCGLGDNQVTTVGGSYTVNISGYEANTVSCQPTGLNNGLTYTSSTPFDTPECSGLSFAGCAIDDVFTNANFTSCFGNPSGSNAFSLISVVPYADGMSTSVQDPYDIFACALSSCLCSLDLCASGNGVCMPVPYCPTRVTESWDSAIINKLQFIPTVIYYTGGCPYGLDAVAPYSSCKITSGCYTDFLLGETSDGECSYWLQPGIQWLDFLGRYGLANAPHANVNVTAVWGGNYYLYGDHGWSQTLIIEDCGQKEISLCESNSIDHTFTTKPVGGYVGEGFQYCSQPCNCGTMIYPPLYPKTDINISISFTYNYSVNTGFGNAPKSIPVNVSTSLPLDFTTGPPAVAACTQQVCYLPQCESVSVDYSVAVTVVDPGVGSFYNGIGTVQLNSINIGFVGYKPDAICIQRAGTSNYGEFCSSAIINGIYYSPWDCDSDPGSAGSRRACFDSNNNFTGWNVAGDCCGCTCGDLSCIYYYADVNGFSIGSYNAYGTIDLCNNIIMLTVYDNNGNEIGTINV